MPKDALPARWVAESDFDVELEWEVPDDFWEPKEPPFEDPAQMLLWEDIPPEPDNWLEAFHMALRNADWPVDNIEAIYSYFGEPVRNPAEGEEEQDRPPSMVFFLNFGGDWLVRNPGFFGTFPDWVENGLAVRTEGRMRLFHLFYWRISARGGRLDGTDWEGTWFTVKAPRKRPVERGPREWFPGM